MSLLPASTTSFNESTTLFRPEVTLARTFRENTSFNILSVTYGRESIVGFFFVATLVFAIGIMMGIMMSTLLTLKEPSYQRSDDIAEPARLERRNAITSLRPS